MLDSRLHPFLKAFMEDEPVAVQSMFYFKPPKARGQDFHQDNFYLRVKPGTCIAAWIAIDDVDPENGGLMVAPGTQGMEVVCPEKTSERSKFFTDHHVPIPAGYEATPVVMKAGDVLFFNGSLIHGSYPNQSADRFRRSLIFHYVPASCVEVASGYRPLLDARGREVFRASAQGGGPCGAPLETMA
jgi:ectoine hydroxylase-related dioxygenase (phytanoyl-CoA dioxygenase family)